MYHRESFSRRDGAKIQTPFRARQGMWMSDLGAGGAGTVWCPSSEAGGHYSLLLTSALGSQGLDFHFWYFKSNLNFEIFLKMWNFLTLKSWHLIQDIYKHWAGMLNAALEPLVHHLWSKGIKCIAHSFIQLHRCVECLLDARHCARY